MGSAGGEVVWAQLTINFRPTRGCIIFARQLERANSIFVYYRILAHSVFSLYRQTVIHSAERSLNMRILLFSLLDILFPLVN